MLTTISLASTSTTFTPEVLRPAFRMVSMSTRIILPILVRHIKSLSSSTITTPTTSPVLAVNFIEITPLPERLCSRYSEAVVRLPIPFSLNIKSSLSSSSIVVAPQTKSSSILNLIAVTPRETLPISLASSTLNLIHCPFLVVTNNHCVSGNTILAVTILSSTSRLIALTPFILIFEYSLRLVRFTIPFLVKNAKPFSSEKSVVGIMDIIFSSGFKSIRFTTALPLAILEPSGILYTFNQ